MPLDNSVFTQSVKLGDSKSARSRDANGYLHIKGCPLATAGVYDYARKQLGDVAECTGDPNEIIGVYRSEESLADPAVAASFENMPIINDHTFLSGLTNDDSRKEDAAPEDKGVDGVLTNVRFDPASKWLVGDLTVYSRSLQEDIDNGKTDLSLGYMSKFSPEEGEYEGKPYKFRQLNFDGNHLAVVGDARVKGARILDSSISPTNQEETQMNKQGKVMDASSVEKLKALLPALQAFLSEEATEPAHQEGAEGGATADAGGEEPKKGIVDEVANPKGDKAGEMQDEGDPMAEIKALLQQVLTKLEGEPSGDTDPGMTDPGAATVTEDKGAGTAAGAGASMSEKAMDAAVQRVYADQAEKAAIYDRASKLTGAFDHRTMDSKAVATYCTKKLGIKCADGAELTALNAYLDGAEATAKAHASSKENVAVGDAAPQSDELSAYLAGTK